VGETAHELFLELRSGLDFGPDRSSFS